MAEHSDHHQITSAGWAYRTNDRGWAIYLDPQTRLWQAQSQAMAIIRAQASTPRNQLPGPVPDSSKLKILPRHTR
jgi:hypothetical protein